MNEQEINELGKAISKLSEEDQEQIAGGTINDKQCAQLQHMLESPAVAYGGPIPKLIDLPKPKHVLTEYGGPMLELKEIKLHEVEKHSEGDSDSSAT